MRLRDEETGLGFQEMVPMVTIVEMGVVIVVVAAAAAAAA
jgi:hypothetical protein